VTEHLPASDAPKSAGPPGLALVALLVVCVVAPPEIHGLGLAAMAIFTTLAVVVSSASASTASQWIWAAVPAAIVASRIAIAPGEAVEPAATLLLAALAGLAASGIRMPTDLLATLFGVAVAFVSGRALYETLWGLAAWAERVRASVPAVDAAAILNRLEQGRPYGGFVTPAALGCFLAMTIPPVAAWAIGKKGSARTLGLAAAALGAAGLLATRSVTAMAALAGAMALAGLRGRIAPRVLAGTALTIGLAVAFAGIARPDAVFAPGREDSPWRLRAGNVRVGLEIAREHPLTGVGPGGYAEAFPQYRRAGDNESRHAHNLPAELMAEWGIPAGLALSALFFWLFVAPVVRASGESRTFASGLSIGLAAFALHNLVDFTAFLPSLLVLAAVSRGWLAARPAVTHAAPRMRVATIALAGGLAIVAAGAGLAREALFDARQAAVAGDHPKALAAASRARRAAPWDADPPQLEAEARMASAGPDIAAALDDADGAVVRAPARAAARAVRARARAAAGDAAGAYADLVEASRLYPARSDYAADRDALGAALGNARAGAPR
jgi:O-antigen ligase